MFKALVIAYYFPPMGLSGVQRTLKFTKYMSKFNWHPTVITAGNAGYYAHDTSLLKEADNSDIRIIRTDALDPNSVLSKFGTINMPREAVRKVLSAVSKTLFIPDNKFSWAKKAYKVADKLLKEEKFDVIYITMPPFSIFPLAAKLKEKYNIPLVVDYRDLWFGNQFAFYPSPYHKFKNKKLESEALRKADKVIAVNRRVKERLITTYPFLDFNDIVIVPHGYDPEDFLNNKPFPLPGDKLKLLYSGIFYENITPKYFLKAFRELAKERPDVAENIELHFAGLLRKENKKLINKLGLHPFVHDHGYLNHDEVIKRIKAVDVLWMMLGNGKNMENVTAGKLFEYFGSGKPIIACLPDGASKMVAKEYKATFLTEPDNIEQIKNTILEVHRLFKEGNLPKPDDDFVMQHDRELLTKKLTQQFQFLLKEEV